MALAQVWQPDVVFLDLGLPGENGYSLARRLRAEAHLEQALIVAQSGYIDDEQRRIASGIDAHLLKPVTMQTLCDILTAWEDREFASA